MVQSTFQVTPGGLHTAYEQPDGAVRQRPEPYPGRPPILRKPLPQDAIARAAERGRGNLAAHMGRSNALPVRDDELFLDTPGHGTSTHPFISPAAHAQPQAVDLSGLSGAPLASASPWHQPAPDSPAVKRARKAIDFFHANAAGVGTAYAPLPTRFVAQTRRLGVDSEQELERRLTELSSLERQANTFVAALETDPELATELQARGWSDSAIDSMATQLAKQCNQQKLAIYTLQAHSLVPVKEDPTSAWVAQQMMDSQQTRDTLRDYLKDTKPLELQVKRNQLADALPRLGGLEQEINSKRAHLDAVRSGPHHASAPDASGQRQLAQQLEQQIADKTEQHSQLSMRAGILQSEIMGLEKEVDPARIPTNERGLTLSSEMIGSFMLQRYEPLRTALHDLRNQTDRAMSLAKKGNRPEMHELENFRGQVDKMIGEMLRAEDQRTASIIERAYAGKQPPQMEFLPETANSLANLVAKHKESTRLPREPNHVIQARRALASARQAHQAAHEQFMGQQEVMQRTGLAINDMVRATAQRTYNELQHAERVHAPVVAQADKDLEKTKLAIEQSRRRQQFCEDTLHQMLDAKVESIMQRGFVSLSSAPAPKLGDEQTIPIRLHYQSRLQQVSSQLSSITLDMAKLRQQAQQQGWPPSSYAAHLHGLDETRRRLQGEKLGINDKLDFVDRR